MFNLEEEDANVPSFGKGDDMGRALTVVGSNARKPSASNIEGYFSYQAEKKRKDKLRQQQDLAKQEELKGEEEDQQEIGEELFKHLAYLK